MGLEQTSADVYDSDEDSEGEVPTLNGLFPACTDSADEDAKGEEEEEEPVEDFENLLEGLSWFCKLQIKILETQRQKANETSETDPTEVIKTILSKNL